MRVSATAKYLRGSTRKARLITEAIKGKPVEEAAAHPAVHAAGGRASDVARVLKSATANAENNLSLSADELVHRRRDRERGPDDQAVAAAGPGSGVPDPQAHDAHHHRRRRPGGLGMGHKVHPYGFRLGYTRTWTAKWYADKEYTTLLKEDIAIRQLLDRRLANASVSGVEIERGINHVTVAIHTAKPGIVIGARRPERRDPAQGDRRAHQAQGQAGDQRDPPARARRVPGRAQHRPAADPPRRLQEGDEAVDPAVDEGRRQGRPHRARRPPRRLGDGPPRVGPRRSHPARARCAPTSATGRCTRTRPTAASASRSGSTGARSPSSAAAARPPRP